MGKKKPKRMTLRNKCDKLFSLYIRGRDKVCVRCGTSDRLQCAHVFSRRYLKVRFDPRNAFALCAGCHKYLTDYPIQHEDFFIDKMGRDEYYALRTEARDTKGKLDYDEVLEELDRLAAALV